MTTPNFCLAILSFIIGFACAILVVRIALRGIRNKARSEHNQTREWAAIIIEHHLFGG